MSDIFDSGLIRKFDGRDFQIWKFRMKVFLRSEDLWDIVVGDEKPPSNAVASRRADQEIGDGVEPEGERIETPISKEAAEFVRKEAKAYSIIRQGVKGKPARQVRTAKTAKEVWDTLLTLYESRSLWNRLSLRTKLSNICMKDGEPVFEYITRVLSITHELAAVGAPVSEQEKVCVLLNGLSDSFHLFVTHIQRSEKANDFEFVTKLLMDHEVLLSIWEARDDAEGGHERRGCSLPSETHAGRNRRTNARRRHLSKRCVKNVGDRKEEDETDRGDEHVLTAVNPEHLESEDWLVATAATCHMTPQKDWFSSYDILACPRNVRMLDNRVEKGIAVGDIRVVLPGGKGAVIRQALHVPDLKMNLLSVTQLTEAGYSVAFDNSSCTIEMGNRKVLAGTREMGIYKLKGVISAKAQTTG